MSDFDRDERRLFTPAQKRDLLVEAGGNCRKCGAELDVGWHAHHREPHSSGGRTDIENGAALCVACHDEEHRAQAIKYGAFRKDYSWQDQSISTFMTQLPTFYSSQKGQFVRAYVNEVSPSGGKTIFSMKLAARMIEDDLVDRVIWCVPRDSIKLGFIDDARQVVMPEAKRLIGSQYIRIDTTLKASYSGVLRNYHGIVVTYQALPGLLEYFDLLSGKHRLMFIFDEAHHGSTGDDDAAMNIWGGAMQQCRNYANSIVCMTGTPLRSDAKKVPFINYVSITADDGRQGFQVDPDYSFSYQKAVTAGIARKIICRNQDPEITYEVVDSNGVAEQHLLPISAIPSHHINKVKNTAFCFTRGVVDDFLKIADEECTRLRNTGDPDAAILVIGRRDTEAGEASLDQIAGRIRKLFGEIATTVQSADGPEAREAIRQFKRGTGRWIVAKEMISEGTNLPRLRIAVILRDIGNRTFYEQLVHRVTRNDADDRPQDAIVVQVALRHLRDWGADLERQALIGFEKQKQLRLEAGADSDRSGEQPTIEGISADLLDETVIIEGDDFTREDPFGRKLHDMIGLETKTTRWQLDKMLKALPGVGISLDAPAAPTASDELFSAEEQFARRRDRAMKWCRAAGQVLGGGDAFKKVIYDCKRTASISGSLENLIRDDAKAIAKITAFENAAYRALQNAKRLKSDQGELL